MQELDHAFKVFDQDQSGSVDYDEFLLKLRGDCLNPKREKVSSFISKPFNRKRFPVQSYSREVISSMKLDSKFYPSLTFDFQRASSSLINTSEFVLRLRAKMLNKIDKNNDIFSGLLLNFTSQQKIFITQKKLQEE